MSIDVIIPWAGNCVYRLSARSYVESRWRSGGFNVIVGEIDEPWVKSLAVRQALLSSTADTLVITDGDVWSDAAIEAACTVDDGGTWAVPFSTVRRLMAPASQAVIDGGPIEGTLAKAPFRAVPGGGLLILTRELYDRCPLDPRFVGWGHEDEAWGQGLTMLAGRPRMWNTPLWHLWHPPQFRGATPERFESQEMRARYLMARRSRDQMELIVSEARDLLKVVISNDGLPPD